MTASTGVLQRAGATLEARAAALTGRPIFWVVLVALLASWPLVWSLRHPAPPPPPVGGPVAAFRLVDQRGAPFGTEDLRGQVWVAGVVSTGCTTTCAAVAAALGRIQGRVKQLVPRFRLVTFSADPGNDTPGRLLDFARAHRASPQGWTFLTGPPGEVRRAIADGPWASPGRGAAQGAGEIAHSSLLALVDGSGRRRGSYDSAVPEAVEALVRDAALLVNRGR